MAPPQSPPHVMKPPPPPLWKHQESALRFMAGRRFTLLDMWMGTGKTRVIVEATTTDQAVLVLCPKSVIQTWVEHFEATRTVCAPRKGSTKRKWNDVKLALEVLQSRGMPLVVVLNYESARLMGQLCGIRWNTIVFDESHRLKGYRSKTSLFAQRLRRKTQALNANLHVYALTGTPLPHDPLDIFGQARALDESSCGFGSNYTVFQRQYAVTKVQFFGGRRVRKVVGFRNQDHLRKLMAQFTFQAGADTLSLPPVIHNNVMLTLEPRAAKAYRQMEQGLVAELADGSVTASNGLVKLLRLQQITSGFARLDDDENEEPSFVNVGTEKANALKDLFDGLAADEPVVVFCKFVHDLDVVHAVAKVLGRMSFELSGRRNQLEPWKCGGPPILAVQIQAGGVGVDLTRAHYCVFYSIGFSLGEYEQALARTHRPPQQHTVHYYHLLASATIDTKVRSALANKRHVVDTVLLDLAAERGVTVTTQGSHP